MTAAAIRAAFVNYRPAASRGVGILTFEVPLEALDAAVRALGGTPLPQTSTWCGIARITNEAAVAEAPPTPPAAAKPTPAERYSANSLGAKAVVRAGLLCEDAKFQAWMKCPDRDSTALRLRVKCGVLSRAEFATDADALAKFLSLEDDFKTAQRVAQYSPKATGANR